MQTLLRDIHAQRCQKSRRRVPRGEGTVRDVRTAYLKKARGNARLPDNNKGVKQTFVGRAAEFLIEYPIFKKRY